MQLPPPPPLNRLPALNPPSPPPSSRYYMHVRTRWLFAEEDQYEGLPVEWGPFSAVPCVVQTPPAPPDPPQQLRVGTRTPTSVELHWLPPRCCNGDGVGSYEARCARALAQQRERVA